jgi:hypothetical protein
MSSFRHSETTVRRRVISAPVSLLSGFALITLVGVGTAHAATTTASPGGTAPRLIHTGNAYLDHPIDVSPRGVEPAHAHAGLTIIATFDSSITQDPNAAAIEQGINDDISVLEHDITTPATDTIEFASVSNGLGASATYYNQEPYSQYRSDLEHQAHLSASDRQALRSLPATLTNPVNGGADVNMTLPLLRATGEAALGNASGHVDSTVLLNTSIMNLSRSGPQDPTKYDLQEVAMHEIVEVLGAGGAGDGLLSDQVGPMDLFRYSASGVRSYTTDPTAEAYFSVNGGVSNRGYFNQQSGGDYGDWSSDLNGEPQVQDAFSTPGVQLNLDQNELIALDVVGYDLRCGA